MDSPEPPSKGPGCLPWAIGGVIVLLLLFVIAIPGLLSSGRASNDRNASSTLKTIATAEADFRANDRDGNRINDFWTGDVKSMYTLTSAEKPGASHPSTDDPPIKLIELSAAGADADGAFVPAGGENLRLDLFTRPSAKAGYWYAALNVDRSAEDRSDATYRQETGSDFITSVKMGDCHHTSRFGFVTFPDTPSHGPWVFIVNEMNVIYRSAVTSAPRSGKAVPPGLNGFSPAYRDWPDDRTLRSFWSKLD